MQIAMQAMLQRKEMPPTWLALHEFDGEALPSEELKTAETEWAKTVLGGLVTSEVGVYRFVNGCGDVEFGF
jgi:hypothetical protein